MTGSEALARFSEIPPSEFRKLGKLARRIRTDARYAARHLCESWGAGSEPEDRKTETVAVALGELSVAPCLARSKELSGELRVRAAALAAGSYFSAQDRLLAKLNRMMESKTTMPPSPAAGMSEEEELPSRECDEAYLLARELLNVEDSELVRVLLRQEFLSLEKKERDNEIARHRKTGKWGKVVDRGPEEPDDQ